MYTLYMKPTCPYCQKVMRHAEEKGIALNYKDIIADESVAEELIARGGKRQVPYLVDEETGTEMYESDAIMQYLDAHAA